MTRFNIFALCCFAQMAGSMAGLWLAGYLPL